MVTNPSDGIDSESAERALPALICTDSSQSHKPMGYGFDDKQQAALVADVQSFINKPSPETRPRLSLAYLRADC